MPLIAGPGALATMVLLSSQHSGDLSALVGINVVMLLVLGADLRLLPGQPAGRAPARAHRHRGADPAARHPARGAVGAVRARRAARLRASCRAEMGLDADSWARAGSTSVLLLAFVGGFFARRRQPARAIAARPRGLGADLRHGGHRLRLPRRAARGAAAGGDGQPRRRRDRAPPRRRRALPRRGAGQRRAGALPRRHRRLGGRAVARGRARGSASTRRRSPSSAAPAPRTAWWRRRRCGSGRSSSAASPTRGVPASVGGGELDVSLLGMSYLDRFASIEIEGDRMTLRR